MHEVNKISSSGTDPSTKEKTGGFLMSAADEADFQGVSEEIS